MVLLLVPVVRSTSSGRPFAEGNAARLAAAASVVAVGWAAGVAASYAGAAMAVRSFERAAAPAVDAEGWLSPALSTSWWPAPVLVLLAVLALATRSGSALAADVEGLV